MSLHNLLSSVGCTIVVDCFESIGKGHAGLLFKLILQIPCIYNVQTNNVLGLHRWSDLSLGLARDQGQRDETKTKAKTKLLETETAANWSQDLTLLGVIVDKG